MFALLILNRINAKRRHQKPVKEDKAEKKASEMLYCRTCLNTEDLMSIFSNKESEEKRAHDLKLVTGLEIKVDDGLSQKICTRCIETINLALQFRRTSKKSEKALLNMVSAKPEKKYSSRLPKTLKPKMESHKIEKVELNDYSYEIFGDQFQDQDNDFEVHVKEKPTRNVIQIHKRRHIGERPYVCDHCGNTFHRRANLVQHIAIHLPEKNFQQPTKKKRVKIPNCSSYKCGSCNKEFKTKATYKAHMRFHTSCCICEVCGKLCPNYNLLQEHKRARHGLNKIHRCAYCEYSSATKEALIIHKRRHTGERPYVCDHCGTTFHRRANLVQHIPIHLPEKNFQCTICNKREKSKKRLRIHQYQVHREHKYRYICPRCPKTYTCPDHVRRHLINFHRVPRNEQGPVEKYVVDM